MKKKSNIKKMWRVIALLLLICICKINSFGQSCFSSFSNEATFDPTPNERDVSTATLSIKAFEGCMRRKSNNSTFPISASVISSCSFELLKNRAEALKSSLSGSINCTEYLTAVNIIFGMNPISKILELFYQPVVLCYSTTIQVTNGSTNCLLKEFLPYFSNEYYKYNNAGTSPTFVPISQQVVTASANTYTSSVKIVHYAGDTNTGFKNAISGEDSLADVKSVIYSFKEINKVIIDNNNSSTVKIWHHIIEMPEKIAGSLKKLRKHSLILSGNDSDGRIKLKNEVYFSLEVIISDNSVNPQFMASPYANLAHLCPPNCNKFYYKLSCTN